MLDMQLFPMAFLHMILWREEECQRWLVHTAWCDRPVAHNLVPGFRDQEGVNQDIQAGPRRQEPKDSRPAQELCKKTANYETLFTTGNERARRSVRTDRGNSRR